MRSLVAFFSILFIPLNLLAGCLIEVCGIDGAGKSTFIQDMKEALTAKGRKVVVLKPVAGDRMMYKMLDELDVFKNTTENKIIHERIDRFKSDYFFLTLLNHKSVMNRLLEEDYDILCDRYLFSFKTYQECFNQSLDQDEALLEELPQADFTCLITVPVDLAMNRIGARDKHAPYENPVFLEKAQQIFLRDANLSQNLIRLNGDDPRPSNVGIVLSILGG